MQAEIMETAIFLKKNLSAILDIARHAPSVHNSQPWLVQLANNSLKIITDSQHTLKDGDPTGRQTTISIGIFAEAVTIAAQHAGLSVNRIAYKDAAATIEFSEKTTGPNHDNNTLIELLYNRCSDRSIFTPADFNQKQIKTLQDIRSSASVTTRIIVDRHIIQAVSELTSKAISVALSSGAFRKELAAYLVPPWSSKKRGISVASLNLPWLQTIFEPLLIRSGVGIKAEAELEARRWLSASGLVLITAEGDMPAYWFEVGRTYLQASLTVERLGFSQATSAAIVEASKYHEDIEQILNTKQRILAVMRIGKSSMNKHFSPRLDVNALITLS